LKIAHRGGVVTESAPECSLGAVQVAIDHGYDMVELDLRGTKDGYVIIHHNETFERTCGVRKRVSELTSEEIRKLRLGNTKEIVPEFENALKLCQGRIGLMLEIKEENEALYRTIYRLVDKYDMLGSTIIFPDRPKIAEVFKEKVRLQITMDHFDSIKSKKDISGLHFAFELPWNLTQDRVEELKGHGVLVIAAINTFQYTYRYPGQNHMRLGKQDIEKMRKIGVDGMQIDSVYQKFLFKKEAKS